MLSAFFGRFYPSVMHTHYSFRYGILSERELLEFAQEGGYTTVPLTDINSTSASLNFARLAPKYGIRPVLGLDFRSGGAQQRFVGLARNNEGFQELNDFLSYYLHHDEPFPDRAPAMPHAFIIYPFERFQRGVLKVEKLRGNEFIGVRPQDLIRLRLSPLNRHIDKLVAWPHMTFQGKRHFNMHRLLRAIDQNTLLSKLDPATTGDPRDRFLTRPQLEDAYSEAPQLLANRDSLLEKCRIEFEFGDDIPHRNQRTYSGSEEADRRLIRRLCREGLRYRYPNPSDEVLKRMEMELDIIEQKGFLAYFLINWDIVRYARSKGYFYVGRGSGANSIVAYLLRITDVDPIELDLYFERFINLYRRNPPDFDIDFSWRDRPDVTRYIFERFPHTALLATYNTFQYRAVVRELGKVFGLPKEEIDRLASGNFHMGELDELSLLVIRYGGYLQDFPSHLSLHASGILISERPLQCYSPTFMPPKGFPTVQFDMIIAEDIGLYKFDILGQRGLGKIKDAMALVRQNHPNDEQVDIHDLKRFKEDAAIKEMLREGDAIGCFYVESPAMRQLMRKLQVDDYLGLVAASSVIRPGVSRSGMMREYILRYRFPEKREEAHPVMREIMPQTFGVMVYQEDVIKVAHYFAGLTLGEADVLRRGMSGKYRSREEFARVRDKFFQNCREKGYTDELSREIWRQVESFAGYAFAKGHSASYAVESYQSLYLKAHYPLEYMCATLNNGGGFYSRELYTHEARMKGAEIMPPSVNHSGLGCALEGKKLYLGFGFLKDLEDGVAEAIVEARTAAGPFEGLDDFLDRVAISMEQLEILLRIDAFRFTGRRKRELLWEAHLKLGPGKSEPIQHRLFRTPRRNFELPPLASSVQEDAFDQLELLGFPLCDPFLLLNEPLPPHPLAHDLRSLVGKRVTVYGYLVTVKLTRTAGGERMFFGNFLDRQGQFLDTVHFPDAARRFPFRGKGVYRLIGVVTEEFDCYVIEVGFMEKMAMMEDPRFSDGKPGTTTLFMPGKKKEGGKLLSPKSQGN